MTRFRAKLMSWVPLLPISAFIVFLGTGSMLDGGIFAGIALNILALILIIYNLSYEIKVDRLHISWRRFWYTWKTIPIDGSRLQVALVGNIGTMKGFLVVNEGRSLELVTELISERDRTEMLRLYEERGGLIQS